MVARIKNDSVMSANIKMTKGQKIDLLFLRHFFEKKKQNARGGEFICVKFF